MARPRSEDKYNAILESAIATFAKRGVSGTPTAAISLGARVAEGTLFTYFPTKEQLINEVYRLLRRELADSLFTAYPKSADVRVRFRHIWDRYVHWGVTHPEKFRVLMQLQVSGSVTADSRATGHAALADIERLAKDSVRRKLIRNQPLPFLAEAMTALADTTIGFMTRTTNTRLDYASAGFDMFWSGIVRPSS